MQRFIQNIKNIISIRNQLPQVFINLTIHTFFLTDTLHILITCIDGSDVLSVLIVGVFVFAHL